MHYRGENLAQTLNWFTERPKTNNTFPPNANFNTGPLTVDIITRLLHAKNIPVTEECLKLLEYTDKLIFHLPNMYHLQHYNTLH